MEYFRCAPSCKYFEMEENMKYLVTAAEMKRYDNNTIERIGIPGMVLMERAALKAFDVVWEELENKPDTEKRVFILAGVGNNGGDGLALGRLLCERGCQVTIQIVGNEEKATGQWRLQREILTHYPVKIGSKEPEGEYTVNVDALFGVGLSREVLGEYAQAINQFNQRRGLKIALDIPSGLNADTGEVCGCAVSADKTVTFGFWKRGLVLGKGREYAGKVIEASVGIGRESFFEDMPAMFFYDEPPKKLMPTRDKAGNKGTFGKVLFIAGSHNMAGAAVLSAKAAYRMGAGMVKVITSPTNRVILQETLPEALLGSWEDLRSSLEWADVVAIGPGLGKGEEAKEAFNIVIDKSKLPLVIDADALNLLAEDESLMQVLAGQERCVILTPHVGELARLTGHSIDEVKANLPQEAMQYAKKVRKIVAAKDSRTFICKEDSPICVNVCGNSGMATAGSGDVLTGMITALLAQGMDGFTAAGVGVYLHACAGDYVASYKGEHACMAGDLANALEEMDKWIC